MTQSTSRKGIARLRFHFTSPFRDGEKMIGMRQRWTQKDQGKFFEKTVVPGAAQWHQGL